MPGFAPHDFGGFELSLTDLPAPPTLAALWRDLESRSDISFFTSWSWIGTWLDTLPQHLRPHLLKATLGGRVVGLAVMVFHLEWRGRVIPVRTWRLHQTGRPELDELCVEYNGFVIDENVAHLVEPLMVRYMLAHTGYWDELQLNAMRRSVRMPPSEPGASMHPPAVVHSRMPAFQIALREIREAGSHQQVVKAKPRYAIRRSLKAYAALGPVTVTEAQNAPQAQSFFDKLIALHQIYWQGKGQAGAFAHPSFVAFHQRLIANALPRGEVQLLAIRAGDHDIGYLYNFVWNGHVYNYQSGINYQDMGGKHSPGMVAHTLAIDLHAQRGHHTYDLMIGDHQYKRALALQTVHVHWARIRRATLSNWLEDTARAWLAR